MSVYEIKATNNACSKMFNVILMAFGGMLLNDEWFVFECWPTDWCMLINTLMLYKS